MRGFFDRWYGDRCPAWTWPVTIAGFVIALMIYALFADLAEQAECEKKGGNLLKGRTCYYVTMKRID